MRCSAVTPDDGGDARSGEMKVARENERPLKLSHYLQAGSPLACFLPSGDPVPGADLGAVLSIQDGPGDYDIRPLNAAMTR